MRLLAETKWVSDCDRNSPVRRHALLACIDVCVAVPLESVATHLSREGPNKQLSSKAGVSAAGSQQLRGGAACECSKAAEPNKSVVRHVFRGVRVPKSTFIQVRRSSDSLHRICVPKSTCDSLHRFRLVNSFCEWAEGNKEGALFAARPCMMDTVEWIGKCVSPASRTDRKHLGLKEYAVVDRVGYEEFKNSREQLGLEEHAMMDRVENIEIEHFVRSSNEPLYSLEALERLSSQYMAQARKQQLNVQDFHVQMQEILFPSFSRAWVWFVDSQAAKGQSRPRVMENAFPTIPICSLGMSKLESALYTSKQAFQFPTARLSCESWASAKGSMQYEVCWFVCQCECVSGAAYSSRAMA
eukprot:1026484-Pelagomonas_calceolata.AAC.1